MAENETFMDTEKRSVLLREIASGRSKEAEVAAALSVIPPEMTVPFGKDQEAFNQALKAFQQNDPVVRQIDMRLTTSTGPYWKDLSQQERTALSIWSSSSGQMLSLVRKHFPSQTAKDFEKIILAVIGVGALVAPLFLTPNGDAPFFPIRIGPPALPESIKATERPVLPRLEIDRRSPFFRPGPRTEEAPAFRRPLPPRPEGPSAPVTSRAPEGPSTPISRRGVPAGHRFVFPKPGGRA